MVKIGRNEPCPCGSGKKYKQCCRTRDEQTARGAWATAQAVADGPRHPEVCHHCSAKLDAAVNTVIALIEDGKIGEAEQIARRLRNEHPNMYDGYDCLAMVHQAKGDKVQAIEYYRKVIAMAHADPDLYEPNFAAYYQDIINDLERNPAAG